MNKKIVISITSHLEGGGIERMVTLLSSGLIKYKNCEVHIITLKPYKHGFPVNENIKLHTLDLTIRTKLGLRLSNRKKSIIIDEYILNNISKSPDLILAHQESVHKSISHSSLQNIHYVIHSNITKSKIEQRKGIKKLFSRIKIHNLYKRKHCICVSDGVKIDLDKNFHIKDSSVIYNAIDIDKILLDSQESCKTPKEDYFIHVGNFSKAKRHDRLIKAYNISNVDINLLMIGSDHGFQSEAYDLIDLYQLNHKVKILNFINNPYPYIANSKGLILSSDFEGLGMVLIEAISLGVPIISTNCESGPSEIVGNQGGNCLSELSADALSEKIKELESEPSRFTLKLNKQFTLDYCVEEYFNLIK